MSNKPSFPSTRMRRNRMKGFSRSEFIFEGDIPHFLEINSIPGMTKESIFPKQVQNKGISLKDLFGDLIKKAVE